MSTGDQARPVVLQCPQCGGHLPPSAQGYVICQYCGSSLVWSGRQGESGEMEEAVVRGLRLRRFAYTDAEGTGLEVFRMLVPVGWQFQGGCRWLLDNPGMPATVAFQLWNPAGAEMFEVLPNMNLIWNRGSLAGMLQPIGSRYFGAEVRPPVSIQDAMRGLVLPRYRSQVSGLQIVREEPLPDLPRQVRSEAPLAGGSAEGGKVRIRYTWQNQPFEEEIYGVVEVFRAPQATMFGISEILVWFVDYLFAFRAAVGRLDASADLFTLMIGSFQLDPHWYAAYKSIVQHLAQRQIQRIRSIGQIGQIYAQTGREIREQNLRDWYARQDVYDRLSTDWSRTIRSVDAFFDPHRQEVVELPAGYGHAWANNLGEYIVTEDPNFNPNLHSNLHWEPMEQS
jgi:hypothetical protein